MDQNTIKLNVEKLSAGYGSAEIIRNIFLPIQKQTVTAIIGPSGCGKSTLLRCMNRIHETVESAYCEGSILLDAKNIFDLAPTEVRRKIGMVFQKPNPFPTLSIFDNVACGLKLNGVRKKSVLAEKVERSLKLAALWEEVKDKLNKPGISLSGGQQQRLCIARTLCVEPEVLLMDEPCSALDPISTTKIEELIHELRRKYTIVVVTHNMQQAARISDQTAFLYMGDLIEFGETKSFFTNPKEKKTEEYITGRFG